MSGNTNLLALLLALLASSPASAAEETRQGRRFEIVCHFEAAAVADEALGTAEAVDEVLARLLPSGSIPRDARPTIHLYRTPEEYRRAEKAITNGKFAENNAFSSYARRDAHIAIEPDQVDETLRRVGLSAQTRRMIAHEATHLLVYFAYRNHRDHPLWLAEGLATYVADEVLARDGLVVRDEPLASTRMTRCRRLLESDRFPDLIEVLTGELPDLTRYERYSVWRQVFRTLATGNLRPRLRKLLAETRRMGAGDGLPRRLRKRFERVFGDPDRLDSRIREAIRTLEPTWEQTYRTLDIRKDGWVQIAFTSKNAVAWRTAPVGTSSYDVSGSFEILPGRNPQMNVLLGRTKDDDFVSVAFRALDGVTVFRYGAEKDEWKRLGWKGRPEITREKRHAFRIRVRPGEIEIFVDGESVIEASTGTAPLEGPWGLGVQAGGAGIWRGVKLEAR